jgi:hypothetical protein
MNRSLYVPPDAFVDRISKVTGTSCLRKIDGVLHSSGVGKQIDYMALPTCKLLCLTVLNNQVSFGSTASTIMNSKFTIQSDTAMYTTLSV